MNTGTSSKLRTLAFRIGTIAPDVTVDVRLEDHGGRWVAIASTGGQERVGLGARPRDALASSLAWLGPATVTALLVDLRLLDVSRSLLAQGA